MLICGSPIEIEIINENFNQEDGTEFNQKINEIVKKGAREIFRLKQQRFFFVHSGPLERNNIVAYRYFIYYVLTLIMYTQQYKFLFMHSVAGIYHVLANLVYG